ncbi:RloB domain-containing protein [Bacillus sp. AFS033286]|uniref:RloB domain-containing protein n=1 Tax=Bacillus sp. AFS033286 TaxID=2033498 RepID=UPI000BFE2C05|nr:RloB domain-containing protein [Bacillus sp. AFS033286]PGX09285.1 hypothetical protein COE07_15020 [Bacillus sp. AFS033286]
MSRSPKKVIHIYVECKQKKICSEKWYFQALERQLENVTFEFYEKHTQFRKLAKKNDDANEYFAAILDVDIDYNNIEASKKARMDIIELFADTPNVEVYLSSRCWENWLVAHFQSFNTFTTNNTEFPIPDYKKKREWYTSNRDLLLSSLLEAVQRCAKQRVIAYRDYNIPLKPEEIPDFTQRALALRIIENCNPISYIDLFIEKVYETNGTPINTIFSKIK